MRTVLSAVALLLAGACTAPRTPSAAQPQPAATVAADGTRVYEVREVDAEPRPRNVHALRRELERSYPAELRDAAISGRVDVRFRLDREGVPRDIRVTRSTDRRFDQPTVESVGSLRFTPALLDGRPVEVWIDLPVQWSLGR